MITKKKLIVNIVFAVLGVVIMILSLTGRAESDMLSGFGAGILAVGAVNVSRYIRYQKDPAFREKIDIAATDERYKYLSMKAWSLTGYILTLGSALLCLVCMLIGHEETARIFGQAVCAVLVVYCIVYLVLSKID